MSHKKLFNKQSVPSFHEKRHYHRTPRFTHQNNSPLPTTTYRSKKLEVQAADTIKASKVNNSMLELEDPGFINQQIEDFMQRLKKTTDATNRSRIKTTYFEETGFDGQMESNMKQDQNVDGQHSIFENKGFCRLSYDHSKKLADTEAYKRYKKQIKSRQFTKSPQPVEKDKKNLQQANTDKQQEINSKEDKQIQIYCKQEIVEYQDIHPAKQSKTLNNG